RSHGIRHVPVAGPRAPPLQLHPHLHELGARLRQLLRRLQTVPQLLAARGLIVPMTTHIHPRVLPRVGLGLGSTLLSLSLAVAMPTAVAGLVCSSLLVESGWYGWFLVPLGIQGAYSRLGIVIVLVFVGFPFVVRTLQPVLESLERDIEEAAACLGANRFQTVVQ